MDVGTILANALANDGMGNATANRGVNDVGVAGTPTTTSSGFSFSNLLHSAVGGVEALGKGVINSAVGNAKGLYQDVAQGDLNQGTANLNQQRAALDATVAKAESQYRAGQISKAQMNNIYKTTGQQYQNLSKNAVKEASFGTVGSVAEHYAGTAAAAATVIAPEIGGAADLAEGATAEGASLASRVGAKALDTVGDTIKAGKGLAGKEATGVSRVAVNTAGKVVRNFAQVQPTVQFGQQTVSDVAHGNIKGAAENAGILAGASLVAKGAPMLAKAVKSALFDTTGMFDHVILKGGQTVNEALDDLKSNLDSGKISESTYNKTVNALKVSQDQNLQNHGTPQMAAKAITNYQANQGRPTTEMTLQQFAKEQGNLASAGRQTQNMAKNLHTVDTNGKLNPLTNEQYARLTISKTNATEKAGVTNLIRQGGTYQDIKEQFPDFVSNPNNASKVQQILEASKTPDQAATRVASEIIGNEEVFLRRPVATEPETSGSPTLDTLLQEHKVSQEETEPYTTDTDANGVKYEYVPVKFKGNYQPTIADSPTAKFSTADNVSEIDRGNKAPLGVVGDAIRRVGLSPEAADTGTMHQQIRENFSSNVQKSLDVSDEKAQNLYNAIRKVQGATKSVYDPRLLSNTTLEQTLAGQHIGMESAGTVRKALNDAYTQLTFAQRGMGDKLVDQAISKLPGFSGYMRLQSYGRFGINPFFGGKVIAKSFMLGQAQAGGSGLGAVDEDVSKYIIQNFGDLNWRSADFVAGSGAPVKPGMVGKVQQNIAGNMVQQILKNNGKTIADLPNDPGLKGEIDHAVQTLFAYPKGGFLSSNLARTLNVAIFPFRFEAKVATVAAKYLAGLNPVTRAAMVAQIAHANSWAQSPAGKQWGQQNSELVGILNYFSPTATLEQVANTISNPGTFHAQDLGEIGGLPFGMVSQILEHQGLLPDTLGSSPYYNPQTGQLETQKIPDDVKGRVQQVFQDAISSMFSYPGATAGLPASKTDIVREVTTGSTTANAKDFKTVTPNAPLQEPGTIGAQPTTPQEAPQGVTSVSPPPPKPETLPHIPRVSTSSTKTKKTAQPIPGAVALP